MHSCLTSFGVQFPFYLCQEESTGGFAGFVDKAARTPQGTIVFWVALFTVIRVAIFLFWKKSPAHKRIGFAHSLARAINELLDAVIYAGIFVFLLVRPYLIQAFRIPSGSMVPTLLINDFIVANKFVYRYSNPKDGDVVVFVPPKAGILDKNGINSEGQVTEDYIKRCIGTPGDVIEMKHDVIYRNGQALTEPYKKYIQFDPQSPTKFWEIGERESEAMDGHPRNFKFVNFQGQMIPCSIQGDLVNASSTYTAKVYLARTLAKKYNMSIPSLMDTLRALPAAPIPRGFYFFMGDDRNNSFDGRAWGLVPRKSIVGRADYIWLPISRMSRIISNPGSALTH